MEEFESRSGHMTYTAFVPPGSIAKGEALAKTGKCVDCHGVDMRGLNEKKHHRLRAVHRGILRANSTISNRAREMVLAQRR